MAKNRDAETKVINLISSGTEIIGDMTATGDVRIDGTLEGNLHTKGKIVIGETGKTKGEVKCKNADISGKIEGKIIVSELISLKPTSMISGEIATNKLAIEPGARFTGNCNMTDAEPKPAGESKIFTDKSEKQK